MTRRPLVAANWKMNGLRASIAELEKIIAGARDLAAVDLVVCPPATLIAGFAAKAQGTPSLSAVRTATPRPRVPIPGIFPLKCCGMLEPRP